MDGSTTTTGPKISSVTVRAERSGVSTVGGNQKPGPSGALPRIALDAGLAAAYWVPVE